MDRLGKMTAFVKVVETGSFTAAAQTLRLSATMVSKHVRELEDQLGVKLLHRTTRRVSLTEVGALFYERCAPLLVELTDLETMASQVDAAPRGLLRVSAPLAFGAARVAPALVEFSRLYPEITVDLILTDRAVDLIEEGFDLAIHTGEVAESTTKTRLLTVFSTLLCAAPSYLAERGTPVRPEDLAQHNCLPHVFHELSKEWSFVGPDNKSHVTRISGTIRTNSVVAQLAAALCGHGLTLLPSFLVVDELAQGRLVQVLSEYQAPEIPVRLLYLPGRHVSAKVRAFIDFLVGRFFNMPD
jgi:DNA-binding transcriptional LysR family regulator